MNIFSLGCPAINAASVIIIVVVPPCENASEAISSVNAPAAEPAAETKSRSAAAAKTDSRVYNRVDVFDPAQTVEWLRDNGYGDYVITTDPKPHKGMLMKLLKAGYEIPGSRLAASNHCAQNDAE